MLRKSIVEVWLFVAFLLILSLIAVGSQGSEAQDNETYTVFLPMTLGDNPNYVPPPSDYAGLIEENVEAGIWTYEEGLIKMMQLLTGEKTADDIQGMRRVARPLGTGVARLAFEYVESGSDQTTAAELDRLLDVLIPPLEGLNDYSEIYQGPDSQALFDTLQNLPPAPSAFCEKSWRNDYPKQSTFRACFVLFPELYDPLDSNVQLSVYVPRYLLEDSTTLDKMIRRKSLAMEAMRKSLTTYKNLDPAKNLQISDTAIIFVPIAKDEYAAEISPALRAHYKWVDPNDPDAPEVCPIYMPRGFDTLSEGDFRQVIAHEVFHCFEDINLKAEQEPGPSTVDWWVEGAAEYFSNVVEPTNNLEHRDYLNSFNTNSATKSLMEMDYEPYIFFQFMANEVGNKALYNLLDNMPTEKAKQGEDPLKAQADAVAGWPGMPDRFHRFGQEYFDGTIEDSGGGLIAADLLPRSYTPPHQDGAKFAKQLDQRIFRASYFRLSRFPLEYKEAKVFDLLIEEMSGIQQSQKDMVDRRYLFGEWEPIASGEIVTPCKLPQENFLLVTQTDYELKDKDHLRAGILEDSDRDCRCYFDVKLTGGVAGVYETPAVFIYDANSQYSNLFIEGIGKGKGEDLIINASQHPYSMGGTGVFNSHGYDLFDNRGGKTLYVSYNLIGTGGLTEITKSEGVNVAGTISGPVRGFKGTSSGLQDEVDAWYEGWFLAAAANSDEAAQCALRWEG